MRAGYVNGSNVHLRLAYREWKPIIYHDYDKNGKIVIKGLMGLVWSEMSKYLNFTYEINEVTEERGDEIANRTNRNMTFQNYIVEMLERGDADACCSYVILNSPFLMEENRGIEFLNPFIFDVGKILSRKKVKNDYADILEVLILQNIKFEVVIITAVFAVFLFTMSLFSDKLVFSIKRKYLGWDIRDMTQPANLRLQKLRSLSFFHIIIPFLRQSLSESFLPKSATGQQALALFIILNTLINIYVGNLITSQLIHDDSSDINTLEQLLRSQKVQPIIRNNSFLYNLFQNSQVEIYKQIWKKIAANPEKNIYERDKPEQYKRLINSIASGSHALLVYNTIHRSIAKSICRNTNKNAILYLSNGEFVPSYGSLLIRRKLDLWIKNKISTFLHNVVESGVLYMWNRLTQARGSPCMPTPAVEYDVPLAIKSFHNTFYLCIFTGWILSWAVLLLEFIAKYVLQKWNCH